MEDKIINFMVNTIMDECISTGDCEKCGAISFCSELVDIKTFPRNLTKKELKEEIRKGILEKVKEW